MAAPESGRELLDQFRRQKADVPCRGGVKDYAPDGSWLQRRKLRSFHDERRALFLEERVQKKASLATGEWNPESKLVVVTKNVGKFWKVMGHMMNGAQVLYPEEALFLMDEGIMEVYHKRLPLSIQEAYIVLLAFANIPLAHYQAYAHLSRLGYILRRHLSSDASDQEEKSSFVTTVHHKGTKRKGDSMSDVDIRNDECSKSNKMPMYFDECSSQSPMEGIIVDDQDDVLNVVESNTCNPRFQNFRQINAHLNEAGSSSLCSVDDKYVSNKGDSKLDKIWSSDLSHRNEDNTDLVETITPIKIINDSISSNDLQTNLANLDREGFSDDVGIIDSCGSAKLGCNIQFTTDNNDTRYATLCHTFETEPAFSEVVKISLPLDLQDIIFPDLSIPDLRLVMPQRDLLPPGVDCTKSIENFNKKLKAVNESFAGASIRRTEARNWKEYKVMCQNFKPDVKWLLDSPAAILWSNKSGVTPLIKPWDATSTNELLDRLKIIKNVSPFHLIAAEDVKCDLAVIFDVFLPDARFRKSAPGSPAVCLCITTQEIPVPDFLTLSHLARQCYDGATLIIAVVDNGDIAFYSFNFVDLPRDIIID